jgi:hypothetical protein
MVFVPPPVQPDFERLRGIISTSKTSIQDRALYQVLTGLLDQLKKFQKITVDDIADINTIIEGINEVILNITNNLENATFLTKDDETLVFSESIRLLAGLGITFDDTIPNQRTINSSATGSELPIGTVFSTYINVNAGTLLGYGTWLLFATGVKAPGTDITFTVY